ncbi:nitroreductase family protein [Ruminococcaceae bacterium OttesenSCG-928-I18]|nr:nitroreductase family protein [Ruminococcaceae bacterium OttesenSCG-928-I18]
MELKEALARRRSVRSYNGRSVSDEDLEAILKAGCAAPIGMRAYDTIHLTVVQKKEALDEIREMVARATDNNPAYNPTYGAKTLVLVSARPRGDSLQMERCDAGCILENMLLQATELGIGSVYLLSVGLAFEEGSPMYEKLQIPGGFKFVSGAAFGYTDEEAEPKELSIRLSMNTVK